MKKILNVCSCRGETKEWCKWSKEDARCLQLQGTEKEWCKWKKRLNVCRYGWWDKEWWKWRRCSMVKAGEMRITFCRFDGRGLGEICLVQNLVERTEKHDALCHGCSSIVALRRSAHCSRRLTTATHNNTAASHHQAAIILLRLQCSPYRSGIWRPRTLLPPPSHSFPNLRLDFAMIFGRVEDHLAGVAIVSWLSNLQVCHWSWIVVAVIVVMSFFWGEDHLFSGMAEWRALQEHCHIRLSFFQRWSWWSLECWRNCTRVRNKILLLIPSLRRICRSSCWLDLVFFFFFFFFSPVMCCHWCSSRRAWAKT